MNAADEVAVAAFLDRRLPFAGISQVIEQVLERMPRLTLRSIDDVIAADAEARRLAQEEIGTPQPARGRSRIAIAFAPVVDVRRVPVGRTVVLTGVIAVVLGLGLMVLIHEFGHFIVARLFGVRVDVFSFGLGPRLFGVKRGATDYRLSAFPVGGYVRMAGENPGDERTGDPDEFLSKKRWQRMFIILAGPTTNLLLAIALTAGLFVYGGEQPTYADKPVVIAGVMKDSPAQEGGIQAGDRIVSFAGAENPTWDRVALELALSARDAAIPVVVERQGQRISLSVKSDVQPFSVLGYPAEPVLGRRAGDWRGSRTRRIEER